MKEKILWSILLLTFSLSGFTQSRNVLLVSSNADRCYCNEVAREVTAKLKDLSVFSRNELWTNWKRLTESRKLQKFPNIGFVLTHEITSISGKYKVVFELKDMRGNSYSNPRFERYIDKSKRAFSINQMVRAIDQELDYFLKHQNKFKTVVKVDQFDCDCMNQNYFKIFSKWLASELKGHRTIKNFYWVHHYADDPINTSNTINGFFFDTDGNDVLKLKVTVTLGNSSGNCKTLDVHKIEYESNRDTILEEISKKLSELRRS